MTGFEIWLESLGWFLTYGDRKQFSTYDNCSRTWKNIMGQGLIVGLAQLDQKTTQVVVRDYKLFIIVPMPSEDQYQILLNKIIALSWKH